MNANDAPSTHGRTRALGLLALLLGLATIGLRWPGVAMYDTLSQYEQATSGDFFDWHPPIMARFWSLLIPLWPGTPPFLILQAVLWWGGLGLLAVALGRAGRPVAGPAVLAVGALPLFVGWDTVVLKDAQLASCLVAVTGFVAHWRLRDVTAFPPSRRRLRSRPELATTDASAAARLPRRALAVILILLAYATLVRGNAVFATVPFGIALFAGSRLHGLPRRAGAAIALMLAVILVSPPINHHLLGARVSGVERALPLYDVAGIAHHAGLDDLPGAHSGEWRESEGRGCYTPFFWNPYGMPTQCQALGAHVAFDAPGGAPIMTLWAGMIATHPIAWAQHRLRHLNANLRFLVGANEADATPPADSEPNDLGLGRPASGAARALVAAAAIQAGTPLGWPFPWLALAGVLLWAGAGARDAMADLGRALAASAVVMSASYGIVSIASDLRYHLWSMVAAALATVLLVSAGALDRRRLGLGLGIVALLCLAGGLARAILPSEPYPYPVAGMLPHSR